MKLVLFSLRGLSNLVFLQRDDLTWFIFPICVSDHYHHYLVYRLSVDTMAPLCRFEPSRSELLDIEPEYVQLIDKIGWGEFFRSFNGNNVELTRKFSILFKENVSQVGNICLVISKDFIVKATKFPQIGDRWFKWGGSINRNGKYFFSLYLNILMINLGILQNNSIPSGGHFYN